MINPYRIDPGSSEQIFIETMRSWGKSIWWCFFFILPGIYKFLSYAYVPIVVFLNPNYQMGTVDALKSSEQQFRKKPWSTIVIFLIFYLVIPIMLSSFLDSYKDFNKTPGPALIVSSVTGFLNLMALLLLAEVYLKDSGLDALKEN